MAPGEPGRLWIRSASNTTGYWRRVAETRELVFGPWLRDGRRRSPRTTDGLCATSGRSDDLFKVDARWVSPPQVEGALLDHPAVAEAAVVGAARRRRAAAPGRVRRADAASAEEGDDLAAELRRHVARALAPHRRRRP